ncbi:MAG: aspartate aminotransferase family protein [Leptospirales bacterium]|nr:aspartate aminotransferase family protein [Leptospirales bacterium]
MKFPQKGTGRSMVMAELESARKDDVRWRDGRAFSLVFYPGHEIYEVVKEAYGLFFSENGLNPSAFPALRKFEQETVSMMADLMCDPSACGNLTSGGTESILLAVYSAREYALKHKPNLTQPEILVPTTVHPAFDKAAHYFGLKIKHIPVGPDYRADVAATAAAVTDQTILIVGSAPQYPHGVVDPIRELSSIALSHGILFHTDACVGGMILPFFRRLGQPIPEFSFELPGVTSISIDLHKYGYAAKGASVVLYRNRSQRRGQFFVQTTWPGGIYGSPGILGTRPGGAIAAAWAVIKHLGEDGFMGLAKSVLQSTNYIRDAIGSIPGLKILGQPHASVLALASDELDIYQIGDELAVLGWHLDKQQDPPSLHLTISYAHEMSREAFIKDLRACTEKVRGSIASRWASFQTAAARALSKVLPISAIRFLSRLASPGGKRQAAMYGMIGSLPVQGEVDELVLDFLDRLYSPEK